MCLAPKVQQFNSRTKAPIALHDIQQIKHFVPPKSKTLKTKPTRAAVAVQQVQIKPRLQEPPFDAIKPKSQEQVKPASSIIAPRSNRQAALNAIFRDSFKLSNAGDLVLLPCIKKEKELTSSSISVGRPESPFIKRTFSFSSVSSEVTGSAASLSLGHGTVYLYEDYLCEEEKKEDFDDEDDEMDRKPAAIGYTTPPCNKYSLSPPPSPIPNRFMQDEIFFPDTLMLPTFP